MIDAIPQEKGRSGDEAARHVQDAMAQRYALECWQSVFSQTRQFSESPAPKEGMAELPPTPSSTPLDLRKSVEPHRIDEVESGSKRPAAQAPQLAAPADSADTSAGRPDSRVRQRQDDDEHATRLAQFFEEERAGVVSGSADGSGNPNDGQSSLSAPAPATTFGEEWGIGLDGAATPRGAQTPGLQDLKGTYLQLIGRAESGTSSPAEPAEELPEMSAGFRPSSKGRSDASSDQAIFITRSEDGLTLAIRQDRTAGVALLNAVLPAAYSLPPGLLSLSRIVVNGRVVYQRDSQGAVESSAKPGLKKPFSFSC